MTDPFAGVRLSAVPPLTHSVQPIRPTSARPARPPGQAERRASERHPVREDVLVRPVGADGVPAGRVFRAAVIEISAGGLRLFCDRPVPPGWAAVRFGSGPDALVRFVGLSRTRKVPGGYEYAGPFSPTAPSADAG